MPTANLEFLNAPAPAWLSGLFIVCTGLTAWLLGRAVRRAGGLFWLLLGGWLLLQAALSLGGIY